MKLDRLFADMQLAEMEHNAFKSEASAEKLELAKLAYESALAKEEVASAPKVEDVEPAAPVQNAFNTAALELLNMVGGFSEEDKTEIIKSFVDRKFKEASTPEKLIQNFVDTTIKEALATNVENIEPATPIQSEASAQKVETVEQVAQEQSEVSKAEEEKKTV